MSFIIYFRLTKKLTTKKKPTVSTVGLINKNLQQIRLSITEILLNFRRKHSFTQSIIYFLVSENAKTNNLLLKS